MKTSKLLTSFAVLMASSLAAFAVPTWIELSTKPSDASGIEGATDTNPSTAAADKYTAYYCTVEAAVEQFGSATESTLTSALGGEDWEASWSWFEENATSFASTQYGRGQYTSLNYDNALDGTANYIAVVFYNNVAFRAFGTGSAELDSGNVIFDDATATSGVGKWTVVPEPTSGILLLLGFAGLALRRRNER